MFARRLLRDADSQFIGDLLSVRATAAYSLRRLYSSYTGNALTLRRSQDNAVADIGFTTAGELGTTALLNHVGYQNLSFPSNDFTGIQGLLSGLNGSPSTTIINGRAFAKVTETVSQQQHVYSPYRGSVSGNTIFSIYAKAAERTQIWVQVGSVGGSFNKVVFDLIAGTFISDGGLTAQMIPEANGVYRCVVSGNITLQAYGVGIFANGFNYLGDGTSGVLLSSAHISNGTTLFPYQPTTTAAWTSLNGFVTTWYDQSGGSNNAIQSTLANQPRIVANGVLQSTNNRPSILNAVDTGLAVPTITELNTSNTTSAVVRCTNATSSAAGRIVCLRSTSALNPLFDFSSTANVRFWVRDSAGNIMQSSALVTDNTYNSLAAVRSINQGYIFTNGFAKTVGFATPDAIGSTSTILGIGIGCDITPSLLFGLEGAIGEVLIFNSALSINELRLLQQNQGAYYGITVI
jgi:hypothetical protein